MAQVKRNLPANAVTQTAIDFTRPVYLVKMLFPAGEQYLSSGPQITYDSNVYQEGQVSVGSFRWNPDGSQQGNILLSNENNAASALVLNGTVNDVGIEIYKTYLISGGGNSDPYLYAKGVMDAAGIDPDVVEVGVLSTNAQTGFLPNRYYTADEGFNWLPVEGEKITWGDEVFILEEARG